MHKWIGFAVKHPRVVIIITFFITIFAAFGVKDLHYDSSTDALVPKDDIAYILNQRSKKIFGDTNTMMLTVIEAQKGVPLFSYDVFSHLDKIVSEIEEFTDFDKEREDQRLNALLELSHVSVEELPNKENGLIGEEQQSATMTELEADLDAQIFNEENTQASSRPATRNSEDMWDLTKPIVADYYAEPVRSHYNYNYDQYRPVSVLQLKEALDEGGRAQLETIFHLHDINPDNDQLITREDFKALLETWEDIYLYKSMEIVKTFMNPLSGEDIVGTAEELKPVHLVPVDDRGKRLIPRSDEDFNSYRKVLLNNPSFESVLYARNRDNNIMALALNLELRPLQENSEIFNYIYTILEKYNTDPVKITSVGSPVYMKFVKQYMESDLLKTMPIIILVIILTFFFNFRLIRGVVLPTVTVLLGTFWTLGIMGFAGVPITMLVNMLPPLLVAVGSSYSIHIFNQYVNDQNDIHKKGRVRGLARSLNHISLTVLLAGTTTFFAFLTLSTNQLTSLRDFGIFAALGTLISVALSTMLIPAVLVQLKLIPQADASLVDINKSGANVLVRKIIDGASWLVMRGSLQTCIVSIAVVIICAYGITTLRTETSPLYYFNEDSYLYQSDLLFGESFKGSIVTGVIFDTGREGGVKDPAFLSFIEEVRHWITLPVNQKKFHMLHTASFGDVIKRMHKAMNGDRDEFYRIPHDAETISDYMEIYSGTDSDSDGRVDNLESFVDPMLRNMKLLVRIGHIDGVPFTMKNIEGGHRALNEYLESRPETKNLTWHFVGEPVSIVALSHYIITGQVKSILYTLIIVVLVVFLLFRSWKAALVSLIPISTSIIVVYGLMGFLGIPLDIPKAILAAIALGIGVDDTIHMLKTIRYHQQAGKSLKDVMSETYREAGLAIVYTSMALVFGFSIFLVSNFAPIFYFGWLVTSTMVATTFSALVILPSVIAVFNIDLSREHGGAFFAWLRRVSPVKEVDDAGMEDREDMIA